MNGDGTCGVFCGDKPRITLQIIGRINVLSFLWVIPRLLSSKSRRFGTLYRFHLHRQVKMPMKMKPIESSETSAFRTQTPGN